MGCQAAEPERRVTAKTGISGFRLIRPVARKTGCRVRLLKKRGLPFVFSKYRRRKAFLQELFCFFILLNVLASFVWCIEITGNEKLDRVFLENALAANGIRTGVLKYRIDTRRAVDRMMLDVGRLSWISISNKGNEGKGRGKEREDLPEIVPRNITMRYRGAEGRHHQAGNRKGRYRDSIGRRYGEKGPGAHIRTCPVKGGGAAQARTRDRGPSWQGHEYEGESTGRT